MPPPAPLPRQLGAPASLGFCCSLWGASEKRGSETCIKLFNLCKYHFLGDRLGGRKQCQCSRHKHVEDAVSQCLCHLLLPTILGSSHGKDSDVSAAARQPKDRQKTFSLTGGYQSKPTEERRWMKDTPMYCIWKEKAQLRGGSCVASE